MADQVVMNLGLGDEKDEDHYETKWNEWLPELWNELGTPPPSMELLPPSYSVTVEDKATTAVPDVIIPPGTWTGCAKLLLVYCFLCWSSLFLVRPVGTPLPL